MDRLVGFLLSAAAIAPWVLAPAFAADEPASESGKTQIETVVVTAQKRGEDLQHVAASVTAISGAVLADQGLTSLKDIAYRVPNLVFVPFDGMTMINIRGAGTTVDTGATAPTVALYVDGIYLPTATMGTTRAVDLERVEVLRGPQGTLYGRNAVGGAVNFISQAPSDTFTGKVTLITGSRSDLGAEGYVSGPITDNLLFRLSGGYEDQTGDELILPSREHINGTHARFVRGALRFDPINNLTIDLAVRYELDTSPTGVQQLVSPYLGGGGPTTNWTDKPYVEYANSPFYGRTETIISSATINWNITDDISLRSISGVVNHSSHQSYEADATTLDLFNVPLPPNDYPRPSVSESQEFNLLGDTGRLKWLVGAYYFHDNTDWVLRILLGDPIVPGTLTVSEGLADETQNYALFGDATLSVTDQFKIEAGLRYNDETQNFLQNYLIRLGNGPYFPGEAAYANGPVPVEVKSQKLLPKIGVQYIASDDMNLYAQYSEGYLSGGLNPEGGSGDAVGAKGLYEPEDLRAYEAGLKSQWLDRSLTLNLAGFYYVYSGVQVTKVIPPTSPLVKNGDAHNYGAELESIWQATDNLRLNLSATWLHARFTNFHDFDSAQPQLGVQNLAGRPVPESPDETVNFGAEYGIPLHFSILSKIVLRGDLYYSDKIVLQYFGRPEATQPAYARVDLSARLLGSDDKTSVALFLNNATDVAVKQHVFYNAGFGYYGNYGTPRTWGLRLSRQF